VTLLARLRLAVLVAAGVGLASCGTASGQTSGAPSTPALTTTPAPTVGTVPAPPTSVEAPAERPPESTTVDDPWSTDIWFGEELTRTQFLDDELRPLLGEPARTTGAASPLEFVEPGRYTYTTPVGDDVPVLALAPGGAPASGDPSSWDVAQGLVIALHQTNLVGPTEPCAPDPGAPLAYGARFAAVGYFVVCPNLAFTGERQPENQWDTAALYTQHPGWSAMGKDIAEVSWLLDAIEAAGSRPDKVAAAGHSQGAVYSLYAGALDDRIDVVVANAGYVDTPTDPEPERWSRPTWYRGFRELPVGFDLLEVVAAITPRCALLASYTEDEILIATVPQPARLADFEERYPSIDWQVVDGPHDWAATELAASRAWLDESWDRCPS
jgi:dienelactone hydrolase